MSLTRASAESILIRRLGALLTAAGLDGTTIDGTNADLNDPLGWALRQTGHSVAAPALVTSAEVAGVADADLDKFLDLAELRALENVQGNLDMVDITLGPRSERLGQLAENVEKRLKRLTDRVADEYGYGLAEISAGVITYELAEHFVGSDDDD